jgi:hypothetical protein
MLQELLPLLPREIGTFAVAVAMTGTLIGAGLWLVGARFSRSLITLLLVTIGGWVGLYLPRYFSWPVDGWAPALGLALLLGAGGFFLHRFWVGVGLGLVLAAWAAVAVWVLCRGDGIWSLPKYVPDTSVVDYAKDLWQSIPLGVQRYLPFGCAIGLVSGLAAALLWPRIGVVMLYSTAGVSMLVGLGLCAMNCARPQWIGSLPAKSSSQLITLLSMVAFGAILQWRIAPSRKAKRSPPRRPMLVEQ